MKPFEYKGWTISKSTQGYTAIHNKNWDGVNRAWEINDSNLAAIYFEIDEIELDQVLTDAGMYEHFENLV